LLASRIQTCEDEADVGRALAGGVAEGSTPRERLARMMVFHIKSIGSIIGDSVIREA
jgi:hypothetical protein